MPHLRHAASTVQAFCPNTSACSWTNKLMAPLLHTAGSAYAGQGLSLVNPPVREARPPCRHPRVHRRHHRPLARANAPTTTTSG